MASSTAAEISLKDVQEAAKRIEPHIHRTPVMTSSTLDGMAGRALHFKCEIFQKIGAFKVSINNNCTIHEVLHVTVISHSFAAAAWFTDSTVESR